MALRRMAEPDPLQSRDDLLELRVLQLTQLEPALQFGDRIGEFLRPRQQRAGIRGPSLFAAIHAADSMQSESRDPEKQDGGRSLLRQRRSYRGRSGNLLFHNGASPIHALDQHRELRPRQPHHAVARRRPNETALLETLGEQAQALSIPVKSLQQTATLASKQEQRTRERVQLQSLSHPRRQTVEATAHIDRFQRQIDSGARVRRQHQPRTAPMAENTRRNAPVSTSPPTRTRQPFGSSTSIDPPRSFTRGRAGSSPGAGASATDKTGEERTGRLSPPTSTGTNPASAPANARLRHV